jgi:hypothetical protein
VKSQVSSTLNLRNLRHPSLTFGATFADTVRTSTLGLAWERRHGVGQDPHPTTATPASSPATATRRTATLRRPLLHPPRRRMRRSTRPRRRAWHDHSRGQVTFAEYVETVRLPSKHVETSTLAAYRSYLDKHFIPTFGRRPMGKILPSGIQRWVTTATETGLSAASVLKYHTMLHSVFERAQRDRVVTSNPCGHTALPQIIKRKERTLRPPSTTPS